MKFHWERSLKEFFVVANKWKFCKITEATFNATCNQNLILCLILHISLETQNTKIVLHNNEDNEVIESN